MMGNDFFECPSCGAPISKMSRAASCPACSAPIGSRGQLRPADGAAFTPAELGDVEAKAVAFNDKLVEDGAEIAERAFNLGCGMSSLLVIGATVLVYFLSGRNWIVAFITAIMAVLAALWAIMLITDISRQSAMRRIYQQEIEPSINDYAHTQGLYRDSFDEIAHTTLPETAPLRQFIPPLPEPEEEFE
jgi:hypothetical protein